MILPTGNERDLRDVPEDVREGMTFHLVDHMDEVFDLALLEKPAAGRPRRRTGRAARSGAAKRRPWSAARSRRTRRGAESGSGAGRGAGTRKD